VLGRFHEVLDILRTNFAIGWMMLPFVEGLFRVEGGIGTVLLVENKWFKLESVYAIIIIVMITGLMQDALLQKLKVILCPYSLINKEKK
jgi:ABC-type nitrate/sulfonate/bicarbonate transport system permease component